MKTFVYAALATVVALAAMLGYGAVLSYFVVPYGPGLTVAAALAPVLLSIAYAFFREARGA